jgi:hypothetical protein
LIIRLSPYTLDLIHWRTTVDVMRHGLMAMLFSAHNDVAIQNRNSLIGRRVSKLQSADVVSRENR